MLRAHQTRHKNSYLGTVKLCGLDGLAVHAGRRRRPTTNKSPPSPFCSTFERLSKHPGGRILTRAGPRPDWFLPFATCLCPSRRGSCGLAQSQTGRPAALYSPPTVQLREIPMKILVNVSALFLSMILALIPFAVIAVNDSAAVKAEVIQAS